MTDAVVPPQPAVGNASWWVYEGSGVPHDDWELPPAPPWRRFTGEPVSRGGGNAAHPSTAGHPDGASDRHNQAAVARRIGTEVLAAAYRADQQEARLVNAAICLRRPLLVTGKPGTGKSTLAYSIAYELAIDPVLHWTITSRSTLAEGLYSYDAIGRLHELNVRKAAPDSRASTSDIGSFIRLGALGTALLPHDRPRVLLIDEIDKSDVDLPNDLLAIFEEGEFVVPELARLSEEQALVDVMTADHGRRVTIARGEVRCSDFPIVVLTSNGEREFPPAFLRRCIRLDLRPPSPEKLARIVAAHLGDSAPEQGADLIEQYLSIRDNHRDLATDQLLNALHMAASGARAADSELEQVITELLRPLNSEGQ